jgi:CBS domain-containing protein
MPCVSDILKTKGTYVASIGRDHTVLEAAQQMNARRIGSLVITDGDRVIGMFTERDILTRVVAAQRDPVRTTVAEAMTTPVVSCCLETPIAECKEVMSSRRIRHLPVIEGGLLVGIVTAGDVTARELLDSRGAVEYLSEYIQGPGVVASEDLA